MAYAAMLLWRRRRRYRAAFRVERYRAAAEHMRVHDPETYRRLLSHANGAEVADAVRRDPDAYVALLLAETGNMGCEARQGPVALQHRGAGVQFAVGPIPYRGCVRPLAVTRSWGPDCPAPIDPVTS
jgi:hypothetical protein